jgi:hypothetical protein
MLHWQARMLARFLEAAAEKAEWIYFETGDTLVFIAANERDQLARLEVTKDPYTLTYKDEWGLLE